MAQVKSIMTTELVTVSEQTPVYAAMRILFQYNITGLPVVEDGMRLVGILTDLDLLDMLDGPDKYESKVGDHMTKGIIACKAEDELSDICKKMPKHTIRRLPVVEDDVLVGIVSLEDILRHILQQHDAG